MNVYLLDTNIIIRLLRNGEHLDKLIELGKGRAAISIITYYEIYVGIEKSPNTKLREKKCQKFEELVDLLTVIHFGREEAKEAAKIRVSLEAIGKGIGPMDTLIAGLALANDCVLVTGNTKEFKRVKGLDVEGWS
jgi:tRNA(fMet)-specific endonuclease VapC